MTSQIRLLDPRLPQKFWDKVRPDDTTGCWLWTASTNNHGYGLAMNIFGRSGAAHRIAWDVLVYPLPKYTPRGPQLDHLCRVRACVNPAHLEVVTPRENVLRGDTIAARRAAQTHCVNGHPFDEKNTIIRTRGLRGCRACNNEAVRRYVRRKKAVVA